MTPRPGPPSIRPSVKAEAAAWLARLHADSRNLADERAFQAWLGQAEEHRLAFDRLTTAWEAAGALRTAPASARARSRDVSRRLVFASIASVVVVGGALAGRSALAEAVYETAPGEQKRVALRDGSMLLLDTATRVRVRFSERMRQVELDCGQVGCRVTPDPARPFELRAATARVVAAKSDFSVRRDGDAVAVVALEGQVEVERRAGVTPAARTLDPGERLITASDGPLLVDRPPLAPLTAWQNGQAIFDDQTLAEAVAEMNRYSAVKLRISDPAVGEMRLSGVYRLGANADFARSVATLLPVSSTAEGDDIRLARLGAN